VHIETAVHVLRMVLGGVFDRFPKLQMVIGHMGEGLPFFMQRFDVMPVELTQLKRPVSAYLRDNLHYTIAGFNFPPTFLDLLLERARNVSPGAGETSCRLRAQGGDACRASLYRLSQSRRGEKGCRP
jgi:hypothetical protein